MLRWSFIILVLEGMFYYIIGRFVWLAYSVTTYYLLVASHQVCCYWQLWKVCEGFLCCAPCITPNYTSGECLTYICVYIYQVTLFYTFFFIYYLYIYIYIYIWKKFAGEKNRSKLSEILLLVLCMKKIGLNHMKFYHV